MIKDQKIWKSTSNGDELAVWMRAADNLGLLYTVISSTVTFSGSLPGIDPSLPPWTEEKTVWTFVIDVTPTG